MCALQLATTKRNWSSSRCDPCDLLLAERNGKCIFLSESSHWKMRDDVAAKAGVGLVSHTFYLFMHGEVVIPLSAIFGQGKQVY